MPVRFWKNFQYLPGYFFHRWVDVRVDRNLGSPRGSSILRVWRGHGRLCNFRHRLIREKLGVVRIRTPFEILVVTTAKVHHDCHRGRLVENGPLRQFQLKRSSCHAMASQTANWNHQTGQRPLVLLVLALTHQLQNSIGAIVVSFLDVKIQNVVEAQVPGIVLLRLHMFMVRTPGQGEVHLFMVSEVPRVEIDDV